MGVVGVNFEVTSGLLQCPIRKMQHCYFPMSLQAKTENSSVRSCSSVRCVLNRLHWHDIIFIYTLGLT